MTKTAKRITVGILVPTTLNVGIAALFAIDGSGFRKIGGEVTYGWDTFWYLFWGGWIALPVIALSVLGMIGLLDWMESE